MDHGCDEEDGYRPEDESEDEQENNNSKHETRIVTITPESWGDEHIEGIDRRCDIPAVLGESMDMGSSEISTSWTEVPLLVQVVRYYCTDLLPDVEMVIRTFSHYSFMEQEMEMVGRYDVMARVIFVGEKRMEQLLQPLRVRTHMFEPMHLEKYEGLRVILDDVDSYCRRIYYMNLAKLYQTCMSSSRSEDMVQSLECEGNDAKRGELGVGRFDMVLLQHLPSDITMEVEGGTVMVRSKEIRATLAQNVDVIHERDMEWPSLPVRELIRNPFNLHM